MRGKSHIATNVATIALADGIIAITSNAFNNDIYQELHSLVMWRLLIETDSTTAQIIVSIVSFIICTALFILGSLFPDIDQEKSTIGKICHLPIKHRTWTHTIWVVLIFALISIKLKCMIWFTLGYTLHIFYDSLSKGGICWFYPISQYRTWSSGAQVKKNHKIYLYRTGETSEIITTMLVVLMGASIFTYNIISTVQTNGWTFLAEQLFAVNQV